MRVRDLPLSSRVVDHFAERGVRELYPPQRAAVDAGVCDGADVVAAVPTASGKTLVAQLALLTADGPGLYVCPLRALAREKYETFAALPGVDVGISTGDFDATGEALAGNDVVVATSEKVDSAIRNGASWVDALACVVVDEVHLLGATGRGPTLEVTLATLRRRNPDLQTVALSATVDNPEAIADWLDAALVESEWRPVDLRTGVAVGGEVDFDDGTSLSVDLDETEIDGDGDADDENDPTEVTAALVADAVADGGQCLAFVRSRREAVDLAERLAEDGLAAELGIDEAAAAAAEEATDVDGTLTGRQLADCLRTGVAFHHAGLRSGHRAVVESAFRERDVACICATPTLAAGVNVPARRVVVRDQRRYGEGGMAWIPTLEVHQMCGRAGRPGLDPHGEAVLVADADTRGEVRERYVEGEPEAVESQLAEPGALRTHVLAAVATGFAATESEILDVFEGTFYARETGAGGLADAVAVAVDDLVAAEMVARETGGVEDYRLVATAVGETTSKQYVRPETGERIVAGLRAAADLSEATTLTAFEVICDTPDMQDTYLGNAERADIYQFARSNAAQLTTDMTDPDDFEGWLESVKTARILDEWIGGATVEELVERYRIGPGDLDSRVERAEWLLSAAEALGETTGVRVPAVSRARSRL
ncbi:DEAD/DEAH box helicase [Halorubrum ezzemoulense]|uniref:ATP-dependent DNA helicase Hel308 n=3 Tax=Halorubrum ezzemoulense TaxID=337243 RepID=A0A256KVU6_HALEZ|nr:MULTISPECIES: DEAD/DEAH box helicase [Halorubrum]MDB2244489.1 DEAD/DEAH box helicase [Halorubrum ezzemoulense]MDB2250735.1 DEAD/DEAH box helicase [Halorubrum ezzemoulense]MDB2263113.1 DEAD/DEAH box helicase [Halorubrum ezzemoulense]MDB2278754.1 DEAD/DEAH box helicase [Halorubrum ezzemoulense]MDB2285816.1 DEAD/DEAH box helicase [Halorubrum ezzemoulense]